MRGAIAVAAVLGLCAPAAEAGSCIPGFDHAAFGEAGVALGPRTEVSGWDSSVGSLAATTTCSAADLGTAAGSVDAGGARLCGEVHATGVGLTGVAVPSVGGSRGSRMFAGPSVLAPGAYTTILCDRCTLSLSSGVYVVDSLTVTGGVLRASNGPVAIYVKRTLDLADGTIANTASPANLVLFGAGATSVRVPGGSFAVYAPGADVLVVGDTDVAGALVGRTVRFRDGAGLRYDRSLATFAPSGFTCPSAEVSRASPVVAPIDGRASVVQGTYDVATGPIRTIASVSDIPAWTFPYRTGHVRARDAASLGGESPFGTGMTLFDAAAAVPLANPSGCSSKGECRYIFTNTNAPSGRTYAPPIATFDDAHASEIGALIAPEDAVPGIGPGEWQTIVRTVLAAPLGGVDRSIAAVIPPSKLAGSAQRPTIAYVGASDGMLHAICASTGGTTATGSYICPRLGTELWAFLPRVQLPLVRTNTARIDGSVHVVDAFGDFAATGKKSWHTVLAFQTGFAVGTRPAVYALDVTDPLSPRLLWEYARPDAAAASDLGTGLVVAMGPTYIGTRLANRVVAQTNNGGTGGPGMYAASFELETGRVAWQLGRGYPAGIPASAIPGGATPVDFTGAGHVTDFVMGDLAGTLWRVGAIGGDMREVYAVGSGRRPIGAPPAIFAATPGASPYAVFASGGYADPLVDVPWRDDAQRVVAVRLAAVTRVDDTARTCATCDLALDATLDGAGFAQSLVSGAHLFVTSDSADVNRPTYGTVGGPTGHIATFDLRTLGSPSRDVLRGGAMSIAVTGSSLVASGSDRQGALAAPPPVTGASVDIGTRATRVLWVRP